MSDKEKSGGADGKDVGTTGERTAATTKPSARNVGPPGERIDDETVGGMNAAEDAKRTRRQE